MFRGGQKPTEDIVEGGRVECRSHILSVFVRQEAVRPQPISSHHTGGEHYTESDRRPIRQQTRSHKRGQGTIKTKA